MRLNITGRTGVGIISPGASNPGRLFQEGKGFYSGIPELDGHAQAAKTGANDDHRRCGTADTLVHGIFPLTLLWEFGYRVEYTSDATCGRWSEPD